MKRGKHICRILKEIRSQIAGANDIDYITSECKFKGDCTGTCPKCEAEIRYLEQQLECRRKDGKTVAILGVSMGIALSVGLASCKNQSRQTVPVQKDTVKICEEEIVMGIVEEQPPSFYEKRNSRAPYMKKKQNTTPPDPNDTIVRDFAETAPSFPGGVEKLLEFSTKNIKYPLSCIQDSIKGRVTISFIVEKNGSLSNLKVVTPVHPDLDNEALRIINSMPKWLPGKECGIPVRTQYSFPILFRLKSNK